MHIRFLGGVFVFMVGLTGCNENSPPVTTLQPPPSGTVLTIPGQQGPARPVAALCKPMPYTVTVIGGGGEIGVDVVKGSLANMKNVSGVGVDVGGVAARAAFAGTISQMIGNQIPIYACRLKAMVPENRRGDVDVAQARLVSMLTRMAGAIAGGTAAMDAMYNTIDTYQVPNRIAFDPALFDAASPDTDNFVAGATIVGHVGATVGGNVSVGTCGGIIMDSITSASGPLRESLVTTRSIFRNFVDPNTEPMVALSMLWLQMVNSLTVLPNKAGAPSTDLSNCLSGLKNGSVRT